MSELGADPKPRKGSGLVFLLILAMLVLAGFVYYFLTGEDSAEETDLAPDATANYDADLKLVNGILGVEMEIEVLNDSADVWNDIGFNFVANGLYDQSIAVFSGRMIETRLTSVTDSKGDLFYRLQDNSFVIQLSEPLEPGEKTKLAVSYTLRLQGFGEKHLGHEDDLFFSNWYPKIAQYEGGWKIPGLRVEEETVYPTYSDFSIRYELDEPRIVVSSAVDGAKEERSSGTLEAARIKDFSINFLKPALWTTASFEVNETEMRFFWPVDGKLSQTTVSEATNAFTFYEEKLGDHPSEEIELLATSEIGQTTNVLGIGETDTNGEIPADTVAVSVAYPWFGHNLLNNPATDAWLSESLTEYAGAAYLTERHGDEDQAFEFAADYVEREKPARYANMPLGERDEGSFGATLYGKTPLLLRDFFNDHGGEETAFRFFSAYYADFQFQHVNSQTFATYLDDYFEGDQSEWLEEWLKLDEARAGR